MPAMTVIIPTLSIGPALEECLSSLGKQTFSNFDIVVVANGMKIHKAKLILSPNLRPRTRLIVSKENRGYGAACNMGARATSASFLLFLNDDTFLQDNCVAELYKSLSAEKDTLFQPKIHHEYAKQTRTGNPCDIYGAAGLGFYGNCGTGEFYASGASLAVCKDIYDSLRGFDEKLFLYHDDVDLSWRARLLGFKISVVRSAVCFHSGGRSSTALPHPVKFYLTQRNRIRVLLKNYSGRKVIVRLPVAVSMVVAGAFFFSIKTRLSGYVKYGLEALYWNLSALRSTLVERRLIQHKRIETDDEIEKAMCKSSMDICALRRRLS